MIEFKHLQEALAQYAKAIEDQYKTNLEQSGRRASGNLIDTIKTNVTYNNNEFAIELNLADYWEYMEYGTGPEHKPDPRSPYWPNVNAIFNWIKIKPILPTPMANGKLPTDRQLAFLISRAIAGESPNQSMLKNPNGGIVGSNDLEHTMQEVNYEQIIEEALDQDILGCLDDLLLIFNG